MNSNFFVSAVLQLSSFFSFMLNNITHLNGNGPGRLFKMAKCALNILCKWESKLYYISTNYSWALTGHISLNMFILFIILFQCSFHKRTFAYKFLLIVLLLVQIRKPIAYTLLLSNCGECRGLSVTDTAASVCFGSRIQLNHTMLH